MAEYIFHPKGTCSREMHIFYEGETLTGLEVIGGCPGNLKGIGQLIKGRKISEVQKALSGVRCGLKKTSCPDQLSIALAEIMAKEGIKA
jgi:uncharacterized protein (TIGR03905 family)